MRSVECHSICVHCKSLRRVVCGWQVRDVLKGALKPTCLSDTESELGGYSWLNALVAAGGGSVKRQLSEGSAHRLAVSSML